MKHFRSIAYNKLLKHPEFDDKQVEVCPDCVTVMNNKGGRLVCPKCHVNVSSFTMSAGNLHDRIGRGNKSGHRKPDMDVQDRFST